MKIYIVYYKFLFNNFIVGVYDDIEVAMEKRSQSIFYHIEINFIRERV